MKLYIHALGKGAQAHYRAVLPAKHCHVPGLQISCLSTLESMDYDAYWLPRCPNPTFLPVIERLKKQGKKIIWELDDDLWNIPLWNPASKLYTGSSLEICNWLAAQADHIVVSTEPLKKVVQENTGRDAHVLPNLIDLDDWPELPPREDGPIKILWAGSQHHDLDLQMLVEPLKSILEQYGDKVQVLFAGDWPQEMTEYAPIKFSHLGRQVPHRSYKNRVGFVDPVPLSDYPRTMCILRPDIGLAPLVACKFNESKSCIKLLEYSMAGAATIASAMPPYHDALGKVTDDGWRDGIDYLLQDEPLRRHLAADRWVWARQEWSWQNSPRKLDWINFFERLL